MNFDKKIINGTKATGKKFHCSIGRLFQTFGQPCFVDQDKSFFCWVLETSDGDVYTVYDWKEETKPGQHDVIEFNIGAKTARIGKKALYDLKKLGLVFNRV